MISNFFNHLKTVITHRYWVFRYCAMCGIFWQGLTHDLSKFSPTEFFEGVKYYKGTSSPIDECKKVNGYSSAWMHHKGRNKHHYEYWQDDFDNGGKALLMPFKYAVEMLCDYLGAGRAYMGKEFTFEDELMWWNNKRKHQLKMHPANCQFITAVLQELVDIADTMRVEAEYDETYYDFVYYILSKDHLKEEYEKAVLNNA